MKGILFYSYFATILHILIVGQVVFGMNKKHELKIAILNIPLANPGRSNQSKKLRKKNELLLRKLRSNRGSGIFR